MSKGTQLCWLWIEPWEMFDETSSLNVDHVYQVLLQSIQNDRSSLFHKLCDNDWSTNHLPNAITYPSNSLPCSDAEKARDLTARVSVPLHFRVNISVTTCWNITVITCCLQQPQWSCPSAKMFFFFFNLILSTLSK